MGDRGKERGRVVNIKESPDFQVMNTPENHDSLVLLAPMSFFRKPILVDSRLGQSHFSPHSAAWGGDPPCCIGKLEVGTCIYSLLYTTHWDPGLTLLGSHTAVKVEEEPVTTRAG